MQQNTKAHHIDKKKTFASKLRQFSKTIINTVQFEDKTQMTINTIYSISAKYST